LGHGENFDERKKLGREVGETARVKPAWADFGEEVGAQHFAAIAEINRAGDMARVAVLGLDGCELRGEFGAEDQGEVFRSGVDHGLGYEVG
jgi:hypothetical protein